MSREIKFRAWDGEKMHYRIVPWQWDFVISLGWHKCEKLTGNGFLGSGGKTGEFLVPGIAFKELMQWTGRQDKNGKDIYESDIVKWQTKQYNPDRALDQNPYDDATLVSFISWKDTGFEVDAESFGWEGEDLWNWNEIEVIGNIWEHPELLVKKD